MDKRINADNPKTDRFEHKKSLGQNFLTTDIVPGWMCDAGLVSGDDIVVEIGPGHGALTKELLARGSIVYAIETDIRAISFLQTNFSTAILDKKLFLIHADIQNFDWAKLLLNQKKYKVVANIPYFLSGFLLRSVLELPYPPQIVVFLMQKEVVERIARAKKSTLLSLSVAVYGKPKYVKTVSRGHFKPAPNVDSAILAITDISHDNLPNLFDKQHFFNLLHSGLGSKRKQLLGALTKNYSRETVTSALLKLNVPLTVRGEDLSVSQWLLLSKLLPINIKEG